MQFQGVIEICIHLYITSAQIQITDRFRHSLHLLQKTTRAYLNKKATYTLPYIKECSYLNIAIFKEFMK